MSVKIAAGEAIDRVWSGHGVRFALATFASDITAAARKASGAPC
jgi:hypothetical protein